MDIFFTHYTSVLSIGRAIQVVLNRLQFRVARLGITAPPLAHPWMCPTPSDRQRRSRRLNMT